MNTIIGIPFLILSLLFTAMIAYCIFMALTVYFTWAFVAAGILIPDVLAIGITVMLLKD